MPRPAERIGKWEGGEANICYFLPERFLFITSLHLADEKWEGGTFGGLNVIICSI